MTIQERPRGIDVTHSVIPRLSATRSKVTKRPARSLSSFGAERPQSARRGSRDPTMSSWGNGGWKDWGTGEWIDNNKNKPMNMTDEEGWIDFNKDKETDDHIKDPNNYQKGGKIWKGWKNYDETKWVDNHKWTPITKK